MQSFFAKPTPQKVVEYIYAQILFIHETGGKTYRYQISPDMSISFTNDVIDKLCDYVHHADIIELLNGYIVIDWS